MCVKLCKNHAISKRRIRQTKVIKKKESLVPTKKSEKYLLKKGWEKKKLYICADNVNTR